ncbi:ABC transporter ATP-binding protein [Herbiconiux sp. KACC 21604]|uniref:ABC transporter ATP-binding protein n=1 Tax=unclassified Herbiconiux TaxID=2618217 RepID=UPI001490C52B|nr:ABC transporter ATP-binding protein [Herbiconiux sp. SALV-R1]QJU55649.1 ABC transporter ATP-binding protein [Herbiconiux sp. SALV-R1]WPO86849.1 ABC transporter ATP-binding protein [Herbiconiux sp. KACC 21604]
MPESSVLVSSKLSVAYGGVKAVSDVDLHVDRGEIVGLIGPNGAGKTSFIDAVSGFAPMTGSVTLNGHELSGQRAHRRSRLGLSRTWQSVSLFEDLTVIENVRVAAAHTPLSERLRGRGHRAEVEPVLERLGIAELGDRLPGELSHGQRVLVGVARAVIAAPALVLMDEPGAGLDDAEGAELGRQLRGLAADGISVLLVDHDMNLVLEVCDRIYVLDFGRQIAQGTPAEIAADPAVIKAYLGSTSDDEKAEA